jgi:CheY-like chemotaxis protein
MEKPSNQENNLAPWPQIDTVLVVDDEDNWCYLAKILLQKHRVGKQILTAHNGKEALKKLHELAARGERLPELILLDIKMPVMDGFELLDEITISPELNLSHTRIYLSTSSFLNRDKEKAKLYPVAGFITKPLTEAHLRDIFS